MIDVLFLRAIIKILSTSMPNIWSDSGTDAGGLGAAIRTPVTWIAYDPISPFPGGAAVQWC